MRISPGMARNPNGVPVYQASSSLDHSNGENSVFKAEPWFFELWKSGKRNGRRGRSAIYPRLTHQSRSLVSPALSDAARKITPLYDEHVRLGAKLVPFGGWLMPVQYTSILDEHQAVRNNVGIFDISHMGQLIAREINRAHVAQHDADQQRREARGRHRGNTHFCSMNAAGIIDDLIVYRIGEGEISARRQRFKHGGRFRLAGETSCRNDVSLTNRSADFGGWQFRDRESSNFSKLLGSDANCRREIKLSILSYDGMKLSIARTGYTGEDGVEVFFPARDAAKFGMTSRERRKSSGSSHAVSARATPCDSKCVIRSTAPIFRPNEIRSKPVSDFSSI